MTLPPLHHQANTTQVLRSPPYNSGSSQDSPSGQTSLQSNYQPSPLLSQSHVSPLSDVSGSYSWEFSDMELLWNFAQSTCYTMRETIALTETDTWTVVIPQMAMKNEYLMHGILALSALHLARLRPSDRDRFYDARDKHIERGIALYRIEINSVTSETCHACWAFSMTLALTEKPGNRFSFTNMRNRLGLVGLMRGGLNVLTPFVAEISQGPLRAIFQSWKARTKELEVLNPSDSARLSQVGTYWSAERSNYTEVQAQVLQRGLDELMEFFGLMTSQDIIPGVACALAWASSFSEELMSMICAQDTGALILLAHFCTMLYRVRDCWWVDGEAEGLLRHVKLLLGPENEHWIRWPLEEVGV